MIIVGIDPGITGALARFENGRLTAVAKMPVFDTRVAGIAVADFLESWDPDVVYLEDTQPMPKNGSIASFKLGLNTGIVIGVIQALGLPLIRIRPSTWKRRMGLIGQNKERSRGLATELFPDFAPSFRLVKNHGQAEAVLIGRYGVYDQIQERNADGNGADADRSAGDRAVRTDDGADRHPAGRTPGDQRPAARPGRRRPGAAQVRPLVRPNQAAPEG